MIEILLTAFYFSTTVGVLACLVSESKIAAPIREYLGPLGQCPICLGFWLAAPVVVVTWNPFLYFLVVGFSNVWMLIILKTYEAIDRTYEEDDGSTNTDN